MSPGNNKGSKRNITAKAASKTAPGRAEGAKPEINQIIKEQRNLKSWSQDQLATALGISRPAISQIEAGERGVSSNELKKLSAIFGVTSDFLLGLETEPEVVLGSPPKRKASQSLERISVPHYRIEKFKNVLLYLLEYG